MTSKIFSTTSGTELPKNGLVYQIQCPGQNTEILIFKIDWSRHKWECGNLFMRIELLDADFVFETPKIISNIVYNTNTIEANVIKEDKILLVPFILKKPIDVYVAARFLITIFCNDNGLEELTTTVNGLELT